MRLNCAMLLTATCLSALAASPASAQAGGNPLGAPSESATEPDPMSAMPPAPVSADEQSPRREEASVGVEEIVVTAQKREQRLQDVPIAITALTAQGVANRGVTNTEDLGNAVPGLVFKRSGTYANPFIRGVGTVTVGQGDESAIAIYVDGVLQVSPNAAIFSLNNIDRIEVLKGPQGTLFGRNATGGVISIVTREPAYDPSLDASISYGNYDTVEGRFYGTTGITDNVAADLAVYASHQGEGWGDDLVRRGDDAYKGKEVNARGKILFQPSNLTDITLSGGYASSKDDRGGAFRLLPGEVDLTGTPAPDFYDTRNSLNSGIESRRFDVAARVNHDLGFADLVSITSYFDLNQTWDYDADSSVGDIIQANLELRDDAFTQELQLTSQGGGQFDWIVGAFYLDSSSAFLPQSLNGAALGGLTFLDIFSTQKTRSIAGFGQATYEILPDLRLTLGGRYTSDRRSVSAYNVLPAPAGRQPTARAKKTFNKFTYRIGLDYKITPDIMLYAAHVTGFKSGLFNTVDPTQPAIEPEEIKSYEIGIKSQLLDNRLQINASAFKYDYKDLQTSKVVLGSIVTVNAASAEIKGFDIDVTAVPIEGLNIQAGLSYLDTEFTRFPDAVAYCGPLRVEVIEGLKKLRIVIGPNETGIEADLTFNGVHAPEVEPGTVDRRHGRVFLDVMRYSQTGNYEGWVKTPNGTYSSDTHKLKGYRDRSWGIRAVGEPEPPGVRKSHHAAGSSGQSVNFRWLHMPAQFDDYTINVKMHEDNDGTLFIEEATRLWHDGRAPEHLGHPDLEYFYSEDRRFVERARITCTKKDGAQTVIDVTQLLPIYLEVGTGYGRSLDVDWTHGEYRGDDVTDMVEYDTSSNDPALFGGIDAVARMECDGDVGYGLFEYCVFGQFDRDGFAGPGYFNKPTD